MTGQSQTGGDAGVRLKPDLRVARFPLRVHSLTTLIGSLAAMGHNTREPSNLEALERFWRRSPFHDQEIREITALNRRVVIRLEEMSLVITGAADLKRCELPAVWLYES